MKKSIIAIVLAIIVYLGNNYQDGIPLESTTAGSSGNATSYSEWRGGDQVLGYGTVVRVLADDNHGSRHQRLILRLPSGETILIAHNIDLAPRIESVREGDRVSFYGEFETNEQGGVVHWTHKDYRGNHVDGWLEHNGQRYW